MDVRQLRYVVAVARTMHFTHAADQLGVAQPALSQAVALLERQLGVALFERSSRRVQLTAAGKLFVDRAEQILTQLDALQKNMLAHAQLLLGKISVGTMVFFFLGQTRLSDAVAEFTHLHPGIELAIDNNTVDQNLDAVRTGKLDLALLNVVEGAKYEDLKFDVLDHDEIAVALPLGHHLSERSKIEFSELKDESFVTYKPGSTMHEVMSALSRVARFTPRVAVQTQNIILVRSLISAGVGVSIGPKSYLASPGPPVALVPLVPSQKIAIAMVTHPSRTANPAARFLVDFLRQRFTA
jgi:DNA-binding transcriptional LysR family regulator